MKIRKWIEFRLPGWQPDDDNEHLEFYEIDEPEFSCYVIVDGQSYEVVRKEWVIDPPVGTTQDIHVICYLEPEEAFEEEEED